jgi:hypothetical protein
MKLTPAIAAKLVKAVSLGADRVQACAYAEVPFAAFREWERKASLGDYACTKLIRRRGARRSGGADAPASRSA